MKSALQATSSRVQVVGPNHVRSRTSCSLSSPSPSASSKSLAYRSPNLRRSVKARSQATDEAMAEMIKQAIKKVEENPEQKEQLRLMMEEMQKEMDKNPEEFQKKVKQQQELQQLQLQTFIGQVMTLDPSDPEVGHVVKDLQENGEDAFNNYITDQPVLEKLQKKIMVKAVVKELDTVGHEDPDLGEYKKAYDELGDAAIDSMLGNADIMKKITLRAVTNDPYSLHGAVRLGDVDTMKYLIENGKDVDAPGSAELNHASPLHIAAATGRVEVAEVLLDSGANIDLATPKTMGNSPLHFAAGYGHLDMVKFLLERGANKYGTNGNGQAAAEMAELLENSPVADDIRAALG